MSRRPLRADSPTLKALVADLYALDRLDHAVLDQVLHSLAILTHDIVLQVRRRQRATEGR